MSMRLLTLLLPCVVLGQGTASIDLSNGVSLQIESSYAQASMAPASGNSFYRLFLDANHLVVYSYELQVERPAGSDEFHLTLKPAGDGFAKRFPGADGGKPVPTIAAARELPVLHSGDRFPVDVFEIAGQGQKAVDTISLRTDGKGPRGGGGFHLSGLKMYVNRVLVAGPSGYTVSGRFAMFYVPGKGGYFLAASPQAGLGFVEAGWVDRARMQFTLENETFDGTADEPILQGQDRGEIWVYHDPGYRPNGNWTEPVNRPVGNQAPGFFTAAANTLSWWLAAAKPGE